MASGRSKHNPFAADNAASAMTGQLSVTIEISPGELLDKLTILEIKREKLTDPAKRANVDAEAAMLAAIAAREIAGSDGIKALTDALKAVNLKLWRIEDDIRDCERRHDFGVDFVELARSVYINNDVRARLKAEINRLLGAKFSEEKAYADY